MHLVEMQENGNRFPEAGAAVIMVALATADTMAQQWEDARDMGRFYGVAEPDHAIGMLYGQSEALGDLLPAQFVIGPDGVIRYVNYTTRASGWASPGVLLDEIAKL